MGEGGTVTAHRVSFLRGSRPRTGVGPRVPPAEAPSIAKELAALGFTKFVFGFEVKSLADATAIKELCERYSRALRQHREDRVVDS